MCSCYSREINMKVKNVCRFWPGDLLSPMMMYHLTHRAQRWSICLLLFSFSLTAPPFSSLITLYLVSRRQKNPQKLHLSPRSCSQTPTFFPVFLSYLHWSINNMGGIRHSNCLDTDVIHNLNQHYMLEILVNMWNVFSFFWYLLLHYSQTLDKNLFKKQTSFIFTLTREHIGEEGWKRKNDQTQLNMNLSDLN